MRGRERREGEKWRGGETREGEGDEMRSFEVARYEPGSEVEEPWRAVLLYMGITGGL
jgi:hypothetical protein